MKVFVIILTLLGLTACDPYSFGFKKNPAYVMEEAFKAVSNLDVTSFSEVTGKEVLCVYANEKGLTYLKKNLAFSDSDVVLSPRFMFRKKLENPVFVGYWSYFHERYEIEVATGKSGEKILRTIVDCHYGEEGTKDPSFAHFQPFELNKKECRVVKLIPKKFITLPLSPKCQNLEVDL